MHDLRPKIRELMSSKSEEDRRSCIQLLFVHLKQNPQDALAWYEQACCHDFIGEEKEAEPCYRRCFELGWKQLPLDEQRSFFVGFGSTLRNNLKFKESITILQEGVRHFPEYTPLKIFLAFSYYSTSQDRTAVETLFETVATHAGLDGYERAIQYYVENLRNHPEVRDSRIREMEPGQVHHIEYYVNDLRRASEFWSWFLTELGYTKSSEWASGVSWSHRNGTYLVFVQVTAENIHLKNNRQGNGLNHIAFQGLSKEHVLFLKRSLLERGIKITFEDESQICFEDPNDFAVEVYVPDPSVL